MTKMRVSLSNALRVLEEHNCVQEAQEEKPEKHIRQQGQVSVCTD